MVQPEQVHGSEGESTHGRGRVSFLFYFCVVSGGGWGCVALVAAGLRFVSFLIAVLQAQATLENMFQGIM